MTLGPCELSPSGQREVGCDETDTTLWHTRQLGEKLIQRWNSENELQGETAAKRMGVQHASMAMDAAHGQQRDAVGVH
jgi:hypothetical protein